MPMTQARPCGLYRAHLQAKGWPLGVVHLSAARQLGFRPTAGLRDRIMPEAQAYFAYHELRPRLRTCSAITADLTRRIALVVFGSPAISSCDLVWPCLRRRIPQILSSAGCSMHYVTVAATKPP